MATRNTQGTHIVVGFDFSEQAVLAVQEALVLARMQEGSVVHVIGVLEPSKGLGRLVHSKVDFKAAEKAQRSIEEVVAGESKNLAVEHYKIFIHTRIGNPVTEIIALADETDADLVIVGTHGRTGLNRLLMGSVAEKLTRGAGCPVLVMRPVEHGTDANADDPAYRPEPPCPSCVAKRFETEGKEWWCDVHATNPGPIIQVGGMRQGTMADWSRYNR